MAFCTNCGAKISDGTKFCPNCGQQMAVEAPVRRAEPSARPEAPYTAPAQQNNASQPTHTGSPKKKKPMNKKTLLIICGVALAVILAIVLIATLGGKNGKDAADDPDLGLYTASSAELMGLEMSVTDLFAEGVTIELKANGKCAMNINGTKGNGKWTLDNGVFHINGGGFDCDGTLENGTLTLENVLDMGVTLTFEKDGLSSGERGSDDASASGEGSTGGEAPGEGSAGDEATALQKQWNGTWYGCMYVREATGAYADISSGSNGYYDVYMVVDLDGDGKGQFSVYLADDDEAFATANGEGTEFGLYAIDGTVLGDIEMYAYNWMFLPMPDYPDQYAMSDSIEDGDSLFGYTLFMKQWGGSWQKEIDSDFAIVPPSVESYHAAIENGELPPVGFAPIGYESSAADTQQPAVADESAASTPPPVILHEGEPSSTGDGMLKSLDDLYRLTKWLWNMEYTYKRTYCTYDFVVDYCGVQGLDDGNEGPNSVSEQGDHYFFWKFSDTQYIYAGFRPNEAGDWVLANMNTSGFQIDDIPDSITVSYETASSLGVEKSEYAGELSATIAEFMTETETTVTLTVPDAGWCYRVDPREIRVYNVPSMDQQNSGSPIIFFGSSDTLDRVNFYYDDFENVKEIADRTIGGVSMKGRTYDYIGMSWTEYYGQMPNGMWMVVKISKIDLAAGSEGDGILNSISFK